MIYDSFLFLISILVVVFYLLLLQMSEERITYRNVFSRYVAASQTKYETKYFINVQSLLEYGILGGAVPLLLH